MIKIKWLTKVYSSAQLPKGQKLLQGGIVSVLNVVIASVVLLFTSASYAQSLLVVTNDFKYQYYDKVPSSGGGQKIAGIVLGTAKKFTKPLPRSLNMYVPIDALLADGTRLSGSTLCFELLSSGGNHKASWSIQVPKKANSKTYLQIDLEKELDRHLDLSEWRDTIQLLRSHTVQAIAVKSWPMQRDCRKDSIYGEDLELLPISWEEPGGDKPSQLVFLLPADANPTLDANWENGSLDEKISCEEAKLGEGRRARFNYYCSIDLTSLKKVDRMMITIRDLGVPYFSPVQLLF